MNIPTEVGATEAEAIGKHSFPAVRSLSSLAALFHLCFLCIMLISHLWRQCLMLCMPRQLCLSIQKHLRQVFGSAKVPLVSQKRRVTHRGGASAEGCEGRHSEHAGS